MDLKFFKTNQHPKSKGIEGQFAPFLKEGGKLPFFSVCLQTYKDNPIESLKPKSTLGDYVFYEETGEGFWIAFRCSYVRLDKSFAHADVFVPEVMFDISFLASYSLMQAYMYRLVSTGNFMIHSAAVNYHNNGILFCGLSGAGKSTQANLWMEHLDCTMLNYDKPCVIRENGRFYAHGSPWSGKEELFLNEYAPLKAIVFVLQSKVNSVRRLGAAEAMSQLYLNNYVYPLTPDIEEQYTDIITDTAQNVPVYELSCDISEQAVEVLYNELFANTYQQAKEGKI